jgi:hypothetical protein
MLSLKTYVNVPASKAKELGKLPLVKLKHRYKLDQSFVKLWNAFFTLPHLLFLRPWLCCQENLSAGTSGHCWQLHYLPENKGITRRCRLS